MNNLNDKDLSKVSGGNDMVISEESNVEGVVVTYKCPNCGHEYTNSYFGSYATQKGYPATECPECHKRYWGGEELV